MEIHTNGTNSRRNSSSINVFHNATSTKFSTTLRRLCIPKRRTSLNTYTTIHSSIYIRNINTPIFIFNTNEKHLQILKQILPKRKNRIWRNPKGKKRLHKHPIQSIFCTNSIIHRSRTILQLHNVSISICHNEIHTNDNSTRINPINNLINRITKILIQCNTNNIPSIK